MKCTAHRTNGEPCKAWAIKGKTVCRVHGGKSLSGFASPTFKTGRYSKDIPTQLMARYQQAINDPDLLALDDELALVDARIGEQLGRVSHEAIGRIWQDVRETYNELNLAIQTKDTKWVKDTLAKLDHLTREGNRDYQSWQDILDLIESRRRLVETERKRRVDMQQMITAERAMLLVGAIVEVIKDHVTDRRTLSAISTGIGNIISTPHAVEVDRETDSAILDARARK